MQIKCVKNLYHLRRLCEQGSILRQLSKCGSTRTLIKRIEAMTPEEFSTFRYAVKNIGEFFSELNYLPVMLDVAAATEEPPPGAPP